MAHSKRDLKKRRIRAFFLTLETKTKKKKEIDKIHRDISEKGLTYIQMKLPVEKITPEFEKSLKNKIEGKIIKAKIREATESDLESITNLYNRAWLTSNTPFRPINVEDLEKVLNDPDTIFLISNVYGIDAGFVILDFEGENKEYGIIAGLGVLPRFQRKGLGTILGIAAWNYFKEKKVKELRCEVYEYNFISQSFIKWIGFEEYGKKTYKKEDFIIEEKI
ncbi:MAG: GNAT family N-acetyltransferase [Promethearchaeota archaeon]